MRSSAFLASSTVPVWKSIRMYWRALMSRAAAGNARSIAQASALVAMATVLLRSSEQKYRGRIMGVRMLVIYSNMPGILLAGFLIPRLGFATVAASYCLFGILMTAAIVYYWRASLWRSDAPANALQAADAQ